MTITEAFNLSYISFGETFEQKKRKENTIQRILKTFRRAKQDGFQEKSKSVTNFNYSQWKLHKRKAGGGPIYHIYTKQS